jgi:DNA-binding NtrC family response regulator
MRILVVDDERSLLLTLAGNLELDGFDVTTAENGEQALALFRSQPFDLVLSDVRMPGMNGVDLFRQIRALRPECPVVLMTAFAVEGLVRDAIAEGVFTVLPKPFDVDKVVVALTRAIRSPTVLVIDEEPPVAATTTEALLACGVRAAHETDAKHAIEAVREGSVDVCVIDLGIHGMSATQLMQELQRLDPSIVHIAVAGHDVPALMREAAANGAFVCLRKPVNPSELVEVIARARGQLRPA